MKTNILLSILVILFLSFCTNHNNIKYIISRNSYRFWDVYELDNGMYQNFSSTYLFTNKNKVYYYRYNINEKSKLKLYNEEDVVFDNNWSINNKMDSIKINGNDYKLVYFSNDTIVLCRNGGTNIYLFESTELHKDVDLPK